ncbi:MAG TPA: sulfite exporter TauE/SafE family protein [Bryobacteraceae bacterium]
MLTLFVATTVRSAFGFGEALIAVPLLAAVIPLQVAAPLAVLLSITIAAVVVAQDWKDIHLRSSVWLLVPTLAGIPVGLWLLTNTHQRTVKGALAIVIMVFAAYSLSGRNRLELKNDSRAWMIACGFCAGILGGAYGMNGPPVVVYGTMRRWSARQFRATLQAYFLPASIVGMAGYAIAGLWTRPVTHYFLAGLPVALPAVLVGRWINHRLSGHTFLNWIYVGLLGIGLLLLAQAMRTRV